MLCALSIGNNSIFTNYSIVSMVIFLNFFGVFFIFLLHISNLYCFLVTPLVTTLTTLYGLIHDKYMINTCIILTKILNQGAMCKIF